MVRRIHDLSIWCLRDQNRWYIDVADQHVAADLCDFDQEQRGKLKHSNVASQALPVGAMHEVILGTVIALLTATLP